MDGECFAARCGKIDIDFFRPIRPIVFLVEGEDQGHRGTGWNGQSRSGCERSAGTIIAAGPECCSAQACTLQD